MSASARIRLWLALPLLFVASGALLLPGILIGPSRDPAVFSAIGQAITQGHLPYVDVWDHKLPGIYLVDAAAQLITGRPADPWIGSWLASVAATAIAGAGALVLAERLGARPILCLLAGLAATLATAQYAISEGGGFTEQIAAAFGVWALISAGGESRRRMFVAGVLSSLALGTTPLLAPAVLGAFALMLRDSPGARRSTRLAWGLAGAAIPAVATLAWLALRGALPAFLDAAVAYNAAYRASEAHVFERSITLIRAIAAPLAFVLVPAVIGFPQIFRMSTNAGPQAASARAVLLWLTASACLLVLGGALYTHYLIPLLVPLAVVGAVGSEHVAQRFTRVTPGSRGLAGAMTAVMLVALATSITTGTVRGAYLAGYYSALQSRAQAVASKVDEATPPGAAIFVWGNEAGIYSLAQRPSASKFVYLYPLTTPGYASSALLTEVLNAFEERPPAVIVDAGSPAPGQPGSPPLLLARPPEGEGRDLDLLSALRDFVRANYREISAGNGWPIYQYAGR